MSVYPSDGDIYAGWKSFGRSFALAGAMALAVAAVGFRFTHAHAASTLPASDQMLAFGALWVGGGLAILMAFAAWGSILVSLSERGGVEVTSEGVRRIFKPGHEEFFPREQIAGLIPRPGGGVVLIDGANTRQMIVPRSIEGYRDCIAELKAMGIERLPTSRLRQPRASRKRTFFEWIYLILTGSVAGNYFSHHSKGQPHFLAGVAFVALMLLAIALEVRKTGKRNWSNWVFGAVAIIAVVWRWWSVR